MVVFTHLGPALMAPISALATVSGVTLLVLRLHWVLWLLGTGAVLFYAGYGVAFIGLLVA